MKSNQLSEEFWTPEREAKAAELAIEYAEKLAEAGFDDAGALHAMGWAFTAKMLRTVGVPDDDPDSLAIGTGVYRAMSLAAQRYLRPLGYPRRRNK